MAINTKHSLPAHHETPKEEEMRSNQLETKRHI